MDDGTKGVKKVRQVVLLRLMLALIVTLTAIVVWQVRDARSHVPSPGEQHQGDLRHIPVRYESFLGAEDVQLKFSDDVFVLLKLAKAYPNGLSVKFRYDGMIQIQEQQKTCEIVVSATPKIVGQNILLGEWNLESFCVDGLSAEETQKFTDTGDAVFALFMNKLKSFPIPLLCGASTIVQMTSAEIVVR